MSKFIMHSPLQSWKNGEPPTVPFVYLGVGAHMESDGKLIITSQLMTDGEIDSEVDDIIRELEQLRKAAKQELFRLQVKMSTK